jgi:hypothetical protein
MAASSERRLFALTLGRHSAAPCAQIFLFWRRLTNKMTLERAATTVAAGHAAAGRRLCPVRPEANATRRQPQPV